MDELGAARRAETALWDGFGLQELADFAVAGGRRAGLVAAEELPGRDVVEFEFGFELGKIGQRRAFPQHFAIELRAVSLQADAIRPGRLGIEWHRFTVFDL